MSRSCQGHILTSVLALPGPVLEKGEVLILMLLEWQAIHLLEALMQIQ